MRTIFWWERRRILLLLQQQQLLLLQLLLRKLNKFDKKSIIPEQLRTFQKKKIIFLTRAMVRLCTYVGLVLSLFPHYLLVSITSKTFTTLNYAYVYARHVLSKKWAHTTRLLCNTWGGRSTRLIVVYRLVLFDYFFYILYDISKVYG